MSSDGSVVTVLAIEGAEIVLRVRTGGGGGVNDYASTRSFALLLLSDARRRAGELGFELDPSPTPLEREAARWDVEQPDWYCSESFMRARVGDYVERTVIVARHNVHDEKKDPGVAARLIALEREVAALQLPPKGAEDRLCTLFHHVELRVTTTDARWLEGLAPGLVFASTAYDVWIRDPRRPKIARERSR